jgi:hypothetical protein
MPYGSNSEAQIIAYGAANTDLDTISLSARQVATSMINSHLDLQVDITTPSTAVITCANTLAAAIISTSPEATAESALWKAGMTMLEKLRGDIVGDAKWGTTLPVQRF